MGVKHFSKIWKIKEKIAELEKELKELDNELMKYVYNNLPKDRLITIPEICKELNLNERLAFRAIFNLERRKLVKRVYTKEYDPAQPLSTLRWKKLPVVEEYRIVEGCKRPPDVSWCPARYVTDAMTKHQICLSCPFAIVKKVRKEKWTI